MIPGCQESKGDSEGSWQGSSGGPQNFLPPGSTSQVPVGPATHPRWLAAAGDGVLYSLGLPSLVGGLPVPGPWWLLANRHRLAFQTHPGVALSAAGQGLVAQASTPSTLEG